MDPKGRIAVPSRLRDRLVEYCGGKLVVTVSLLEKCLVALPFPDWLEFEDRLRQFPAFDKKGQAINHLLIGHATECDVDGHGRMLVPQTLRERAGLDKRIRMVGQVNRFELWDDALWAARREAMFGEVEEMLTDPSEALRGLVF